MELQGGSVVRWSPQGLVRHHVGGEPNGLAWGTDGLLYFCDAGGNAVRRLDPSSGLAEPVACAASDGRPLQGPNDLAFDPEGTLLFTCPAGSWEEPIGYVCCMRRGTGVHRIAEGLSFPNGLALVPRRGGGSGLDLVVAETRMKRLWRGAWNPDTCVWESPAPWADVGGTTGPDGMALGGDGLLYVAVFGAGCIRAVTEDGRIALELEVPGMNPTNCAFDPSGELGLVVTESQKGLLLSVPMAR